jgi:hypothetical protein
VVSLNVVTFVPVAADLIARFQIGASAYQALGAGLAGNNAAESWHYCKKVLSRKPLVFSVKR